ncbi:LPXTG cell wall anchor domain-containing protein [Desulfovibrio sp. OttesenSCG-928-M16]|nr:LPXTG cell wall anchor domain-containing protein [Desulfovibrio sp. OttesenSCG-928-M16]
MNSTWLGALVFVLLVGAVGLYFTRKNRHSEK